MKYKAPKNSISDIPIPLLIGFREVLSSSLSISITFTDAKGQELEIEKSKIGRKYVQDICKEFHFNPRVSPHTWNMCNSWDELAAKNIMYNSPIKEECWCKFACFAVPVMINGKVGGIIMAGERRIKDKYNVEDYEKVKLLGIDKLKLGEPFINLKEEAKEELLKRYNNLFEQSLNDSNISQVHYERCKIIINLFAKVLGAMLDANVFIEEFVPNEEMISKISDIITTQIKDSYNKAILLSVLLCGFQAAVSNWLYLLDPAALSVELSKGHILSGYVIFIDIRDFTKLCEQFKFEKVQEAKLSLFGSIIDIVHENGGVVDSFVGDAMVIHFSSDTGTLTRPTEQRVADCSFKISQLEIYVDSENKVPFNLGIGIAYGDFYYAHDYFKSKKPRLEVGIVGPTVNRASRLCDLARKYGAIDQYLVPPQLVFENKVAVYFQGISGYKIVQLDYVKLKGYSNYELVHTIRRSNESQQRGKQILNLACGALGSPSNRVIDAMADYYHKVRSDQDKDWKTVSTKIADLLHCHEDRLSFRVNTSCAISGAFSICKEVLSKENRVRNPILLMSSSEHPAVQAIAETTFKNNIYNFDVQELLENKSNLKEWLKKYDKAHIILFPHISWGRGTILPYKQISKAWKSLASNKMSIIDGAHSLGHINVTLENDSNPVVDFDFYATCGHKWLGGPQGSGILYTSQRLRDKEYVFKRNKLLDSFTLHQDHPQAPTGLRSVACGLLEATLEFCGVQPDGTGKETWEKTALSNFEKIKKLSSILRAKLEILETSNHINIVKSQSPDFPSGITSFILKKSGDLVDLKQYLHKNGFRTTEINIPNFHTIRLCTSYNMDEDDIQNFFETLFQYFKL